jgi:hypothetical protein
VRATLSAFLLRYKHSNSDRSLAQRSPTECGVSDCDRSATECGVSDCDRSPTECGVSDCDRKSR